LPENVLRTVPAHAIKFNAANMKTPFSLLRPLELFAILLLLVCSSQAQFNYTTNDGTIMITGYTGASGVIVIPDTINGLPVTSITNYAFANSYNVTSVTIPSSVTNIGFAAFINNAGLTNISVNLGNSNYVSVGGVLFNQSMTSLITYPEGVTGNYVIPGSVTTIVSNAFDQCSGLTNVMIPNSVTSLGGFAFFECSALTNVTIPNSVTNFVGGVFAGCYGLTNIAVNPLNPNYISVGGVVFNKSLTTLIQYPAGLISNYVIPSDVNNIGNYAFADCPGLTSVMIPNSVTSIGDSAFIGSYLRNVTIPSSVTNIGTFAFAYCGILRQTFFQGNEPTVDGVSGSVDGTVFWGDSVISYYLPGMSGWGAPYFGGWPTAQWYQLQPQILGSAYGLGVSSNGFQFTISWATNTAVVVQTSTNLHNWTPVSTNTLVNGTNAFVDSAWNKTPQQFYRVRQQ
jgi:hypothetical protein